MASPIPLVPPSTTATRSLREKSSVGVMGLNSNIQRHHSEIPVRFATIERNGRPEACALVDGKLMPLGGEGFTDLISLIAGGADALDRARRLIDGRGPEAHGAVAFESAAVCAPVPRPPKIICIGLNYRDHAAESKMAIPDVPTVFSKYATSVTGHGDWKSTRLNSSHIPLHR